MDIVGVNTAGSANLDSTAGISDAGATSVTVTGLADVAGTSIGLGGGTFNAGTLTFNSAGAVVISEDSSMDIVGVNTAGSANLDSTAGISDAGATSVTVTGLADVAGTSISLGGGTFNAGTLTFNSAGAVVISEDSGTNLAGASTASSLDLDSAGQIVDEVGATTVITGLADLTGTSITLDNVAAHDFGSLTTNTVGGPNGPQLIRETNGIAGLDLNAGAGDIELESGGALTDTDGLNDFTATNLILNVTAGGGIGTGLNRIATTVSNLDVSNVGGGGIFITNTGALILTNLGGPNANAVSGVGGGGEIRASSPLTIAANAVTAGGMTYTASDSATDDVDHLTVTGAGTEVRDDTALTLNAGDDLNINAGTTVEVTGALSTLILNFDALGGGIGDAGGETANLLGVINSGGTEIVLHFRVSFSNCRSRGTIICRG
jgi:hypothetical protein